MAESQKEYLVGTVRPTNRPEAGQELDLDTLIPAKIKFLSSTMNFTRGTEEEFSTSMPALPAPGERNCASACAIGFRAMVDYLRKCRRRFQLGD